MHINFDHLKAVQLLHACRFWFLFKSATNDRTASFNWSRDSIYIAVILLGVGGSTIMVISLSMISMLIGEYSVSVIHDCSKYRL